MKRREMLPTNSEKQRMGKENRAGIKVVSVLALLAIVSVLLSPGHAETYGEQLNPTGDPIGGGPGYRDIKASDGADFVVSTKEELIEALRKAKSGMLIYVRDDAKIDMTGSIDKTIPGGVTLASGRGRNGSQGALIFSNTLTKNDREGGIDTPLFKTGGHKVRVTGLRIRGPFAEAGDWHFEHVGVACGIRSNHENLEVDNCEWWAWNKWAINLQKASGAHIHHNYIHHTRRWGYGYGVWVGFHGAALVEANLFDFCRHHIGSPGQTSSTYEACFNICLDHDVQPSFDRHGNSGQGGGLTLIHHNEFRNADEPAILLRGTPVLAARFHHNWFFHPNQETAFRIVNNVSKDFYIYENRYGRGPLAFHPVAKATPTPATGFAPLSVQFDGSGSKDKEGGRIVQYRWHFPDTKAPIGPEAFGKTASYTFKDPGRYNVALTVSNEKGIPTKILTPVIVKPPQGGYVLSAWVKDSYSGPLKGFYRIQVLIDGNIIWEDDVAGNEGGWQHLLLDLGKWVEGKKTVELAFRLQADEAVTDPRKQVIACFYYIDDVHLFGGSLKGGDFEIGNDWKYREEPASKFHGGKWSGEARSGKYVYRLAIFGYLGKVPAGALCEVKQNVAIGPKPQVKED